MELKCGLNWGGLADVLRLDCHDTSKSTLNAKTRDLLQRLDALAACTSMASIVAFVQSKRGFAQQERDYLMSPLLDHIYTSLTRNFVLTPGVNSHDERRPVDCKKPSQSAGSHPLRTHSVREDLALVMACINNHDDAVQFFLARGADPNLGRSAELKEDPTLVLPAESKHADMVELARSPLLLASALGHERCVQRLIEHGAAVCAENHIALRQAASLGHTAVVDALIKAGADVHACTNAAIVSAASGGHVSTVQLLVAAGANTHIRSDYALTCAIEKGRVNLVEYFLDIGFDLHCDSDRALRHAVSFGHPAVVDLLLKRGANARVLNNMPLCTAASGRVPAIADLLITAGADVHANNEEPLALAIRVSEWPMVQLLLQRGARVLPLATRDWGGIREAGARGQIKSLESLLDAGMDISIIVDRALYAAADEGHIAIVDLLETRGADPAKVRTARQVWDAMQSSVQ